VLCVVVVQVGVLHLEVSTLVVLLAVLAVVEGLHHLSVLLGGEKLHGLCHLLAVSGILNQTSNLAGNTLEALLGLQDGHVHVLDATDHVLGRTLFTRYISLPLACCLDWNCGHTREEEEQGSGDQDWDDDHGHGALSSLDGSVCWSRGNSIVTIVWRSSVTGVGSSVSSFWSSVAGVWNSVGGLRLSVS